LIKEQVGIGPNFIDSDNSDEEEILEFVDYYPKDDSEGSDEEDFLAASEAAVAAGWEPLFGYYTFDWAGNWSHGSWAPNSDLEKASERSESDKEELRDGEDKWEPWKKRSLETHQNKRLT
jgi:hypothetical protein